MVNDKISVFISNVLLNYMFNFQILSSNELSAISTYWFSIEEYLSWAKFRMEKVCYEYSDKPKTAQTIRSLDKKLIDIFPFMARVPDRTYVMTQAFNLLDEIDDCPRFSREITVKKEPEKQVEMRADSDEQVVFSRDNLTPQLTLPISSNPSPQITPPISKPTPPVSTTPSPSSTPSPKMTPNSSIPSTPIFSPPNTPQQTPPKSKSPPPRKQINLAQTTAMLRKEASAIGVKNPFLLTISQLRKQLVLYNSGKPLTQ